MELPLEFDRELAFEDAVNDGRTLLFMNRLFEFADCQGLLVGANSEALELNGFPALESRPCFLEEQNGSYRPTFYMHHNGEKLLGFPVRHEGEPFALLVVKENSRNGNQVKSDKLPVLVEILETYFDLMHGQRMISEVHQNSLESSYKELLKRNRDIQASEQRYRELAETLEQKVEERRRELEQAQKKLVHQEKMACIGQLAAGVAHEINNPTGYVQSNLQTLKNYFRYILEILEGYRNADNPQNEALLDIERRWKELDMDYILGDLELLINQSLNGTERITKIVKGLSRFSHVDKNDIELIDINALVESTIEMLRNEIRHKAELIEDFQEIPRIKGIPSQLSQVFINLIVNALQSVEGYGRLDVSTRHVNEMVEVLVKDNGSGIEKEHLDRLFDPFFTTKPVGKGTGLGLSISYEIVKNHGGEINVQSSPGEGSSFIVTIPETGIKEDQAK